MEHDEGDERPPATPASLLAAHHVPAQPNATPQDTPHYFADTREIYGTVQVATGSERCAGAAMWQPLAVTVQSRKVGELSDEPGPPWTAAAQPAVQTAALAESVVDQYENDGERTPYQLSPQRLVRSRRNRPDGLRLRSALRACVYPARPRRCRRRDVVAGASALRLPRVDADHGKRPHWQSPTAAT